MPGYVKGMHRPFTLTLMPDGTHLSDHTTASQAHRAGRDYCDTDLFSDRVKQFVRIQGPSTTEHWRKRAVPYTDGGGFFLRYVKCDASGGADNGAP